MSIKARDELRRIVAQDYGVTLTQAQVNELGHALLRLTAVTRRSLAEAGANTSSSSAREHGFLDPKTSM